MCTDMNSNHIDDLHLAQDSLAIGGSSVKIGINYLYINLVKPPIAV